MVRGPRITEADVQSAILDLLAAKHIFAGRLNTMGGYKIGSVFVPKSHTFGPGTPDILAFPFSGDANSPYPLWIEVKKPGKSQSPEQVSFQRMVQEMAHSYIVAESVEDVLAAL